MSISRSFRDVARNVVLELFAFAVAAFLILAFYAPRFSHPSSFLLGDGLEQNVPHRVYATHAIQSGRLPHWSDATFGGYPFLSDPQSAVFFPPFLFLELIGWIPDTSARFDALALGFVVAAGLGAVFLARTLGIRRTAAVAAGVFFALNGYMVNHLSHTVITSAIAASVWAMGCGVLAMCFLSLSAALVSGLLVASSILAGHWQTSMFGCLALAAGCCYLILRSWFAERSLPLAWRRIRLFTLIFLVGVGGSLVQVLPTLEFLRHSTREKLGLADALAYSLPLKQLVGLLMPSLYQPLVWRIPRENRWELCWNTWGIDGAWEFHFWIGIVGLALAVYGFFVSAKRPSSWFVMAVFIFTLVASMGEDFPVYRWLYEYFPGFRQVRIPPRMLWVGELALAVLIGRGVESVEAVPRWPWRLWASRFALLSIILASCAGVYLLLWALMLAGSWTSALEMLFVINPQYRIGIHRSEADFLSDMNQQLVLGLAIICFTGLWIWGAGRLRKRGRILAVLAIAMLWGELTLYGICKNTRVGEPGFSSAITPLHALITEPVNGRLHTWIPGPWERNTGEASGIPMTVGYNPLVLRWVNSLRPLEEPTNGLRSRENELDVWNASHVAVPGNIYEQILPETSKAVKLTTGTGAIYLAQESKNLREELTIRLSTPVSLKRIYFVTSAMGVALESDGTTVGLVEVLGPHMAEAPFTSMPLVLGSSTAEWKYDDPHLRPRPIHKRPLAAYQEKRDESSSVTTYFLSSLPVETTAPCSAVRIVSQLKSPRFLAVSHIVFEPTQGEPFGVPAIAGLGYRWVPSANPNVWVYFARPTALGWCWMVPQAQRVSYKDDFQWVKERLGDPAWNPRQLVWIDKKAVASDDEVAKRNAHSPDKYVGTVEVEHPYPEYWRIRTSANDRGWLVISQTWYHGWRALIDGISAPLVRADGPFSALHVPEGTHVVELRYATPWFWLGACVSGVTWCAALVVILLRTLVRRRTNLADHVNRDALRSAAL